MSDIVIHLEVDGTWVETGRKIPVNQCDHCHRADWVEERFTIGEATEAGLLDFMDSPSSPQDPGPIPNP